MSKNTALTLGEIEQSKNSPTCRLQPSTTPPSRRASYSPSLPGLSRSVKTPAYTINEAQTLTQDEFSEVLKGVLGSGE